MDYEVKVGPSYRHSPSDECDDTSHSQNDGNSANQYTCAGSCSHDAATLSRARLCGITGMHHCACKLAALSCKRMWYASEFERNLCMSLRERAINSNDICVRV
eukprot:6182636-Pleurochrysis_carterae.AAC.1